MWRVWLALIVLVVGGCAPGAVRSGPLEPLVVGSEAYLTLDWGAEPRGSLSVVRGYVTNQSPYTFDHLRVLVDALDPAGAIVAQQLVWSPGLLGGWGRSYFEASMVPAPTYRARVFSYDRVETDGRRRPFGPMR
jgi:hypothetical protein